MRQWDIMVYPFKDAGPHPAVILSSDARCRNESLTHVNALLCTSVRLNRELKPNEAALDEADGLDWKTAVRCDFIHVLAKAELVQSRGQVSHARRKVLARKIAECLGWPL